MESIKNRDESWLQVVREAFAQTDGSSQAMARAICAQMATRPAGVLMGAAFVEGLTEMARYADQTPDSMGDAIDLETEAVAVARRVVRPLLQAKMQARLDELDEQLAGTTQCRECNGPTESQGRRGRNWDGMVGPLVLKRRYSYCKGWGKGRAPAQQALGLPDGDFTPRLEEVCTMMATTLPFGTATGLVSKLCGIQVSIKAVEGMVERRAEQVAAQDQEEAARVEQPRRPGRREPAERHRRAGVLHPAAGGGQQPPRAGRRGPAPQPPEVVGQFGAAQWIRVFKQDLPRAVNLDELLADNPAVVPGDPAQLESDYAILQTEPPAGGTGKRSRKRNQGNIAPTTRAVVRRIELYHFTGQYDPITHQALCADLTCTVPSPGELGDLISVQMSAANVVPDAVLVAKSGTGVGTVSSADRVNPQARQLIQKQAQEDPEVLSMWLEEAILATEAEAASRLECKIRAA